MDDTRYQEFFSQPTNPYHRQFEALRAVFAEGRSQKDVAQQFGFNYRSLRQCVYEFRRQQDHPASASMPSPFFERRKRDAHGPRNLTNKSAPKKLLKLPTGDY